MGIFQILLIEFKNIYKQLNYIFILIDFLFYALWSLESRYLLESEIMLDN